MHTFTKQTVGRPAQWEEAGLRWLAAQSAAGGATVVRVLGRDDSGLTEERIETASPNPADATAFGGQLAITHRIEGARWGEGPAGWTGPGYQGPNEHLLELPVRAHERWGRMYAEDRVRPLLADSGIRGSGLDALERLCGRLERGDFDTDDTPARLHGDLWSGNLLWSPLGVVLIDPSAHVGHRETDLAALALFGTPHLDRIVAGYERVQPLAPGWRDRVELHQLSMVLMHAVVFGGSYRDHAAGIARHYTSG
ncbi:fructosamine kinase family protein [Mycetocola reblochoni]|uniref:Ribulosamine/erythrulosamine 3-kinase potentially involved in protein deglycation n=2 Tax=Mycetocola reblochoni TaxID=331618 RepID=A0A1R4IKW3_9MICO|nr:fructosamine kinase family protein [Mycetocola reblochoni]RLP70145.1 fructosamine kinase [Mycetocola reblochoni]SJN20418.1 Ribulosamine/erythrulosamine 3-kinase potentially involved in protein deglycation [Mycetocola reblochoni REB411]